MSNRFVVRGWTVGYILSESRVVADDTDLRVFRSLTRYLKRGILLTLLFIVKSVITYTLLYYHQ